MSIRPDPLEQIYDEVYGKTFALYSRTDIDKFIEPFRVRFERNGIVPSKIFGGARCLDAASGSGRGAIFMLSAGAASVTALDISERNVHTTVRNVELFGGTVDARLGNLAALPFDDESFDVVWCNGAIMHTERPDNCLHEVARVLKPGGWLWLYVYGAGGIYFFVIDEIRRRMQDRIAGELVATLKLMDYPIDRIAEFLDDWKVPYLRTYLRADVSRCLSSLGFAGTDNLAFGMDYDTNHRIMLHPKDRDWFGEGDLRFLTRKTGATPAAIPQELSALNRRDQLYDQRIIAVLGPPLEHLFDLTRSNGMSAVAAAAKLQYELREMLKLPGGFDIGRLVGTIEEISAFVRSAGVT